MDTNPSGIGDPTPMGQSDSGASQAELHKRNKKTIIAIVIAALVALGGGLAAWAIIAQPFAPKAPSLGYGALSDERMSEIIAESPRDTAMEGDIIVSQSGEDASQFTLHLDGAFTEDGDGSISVDMTTSASGMNFDTKFDTVVTRDGLYGKVISSDMGLSGLGDTWYYLPYNAYLATMLGTVDDDTASIYSCMIDASRDMQGQEELVAQVYQSHPFLEITPASTELITDSGIEVYAMEIKPGELAAFVQSLSEKTEFIKSIAKCVGEEYESTDLKFSADDIKELEEGLAELPKIFIGLDGSDVKRIAAEYTDDESHAKITVNLKFSYPENVEVEIPSEYADFTEVLRLMLGSGV